MVKVPVRLTFEGGLLSSNYGTCIQVILLSIDSLRLPPDWKALFARADIPEAALDDADVTRSLIDVVTRTVTLTSDGRPADVPRLDLSLGEEGACSGKSIFSHL